MTSSSSTNHSLVCPNLGSFISHSLTELNPMGIALLATDMDGTVTQQGKLDRSFLESLEQLVQANLPTLIVTGRSAGWVSGLAHYLPIAGAIAENGGVFFHNGQAEFLVAIESLSDHRAALREMFEQLRLRYPQLQETHDNPFRQTDWTFDVMGLAPDALRDLAQECDRSGWGFTYSTVQCHIMKREQNKAAGLHRVLEQVFQIPASKVVTVGDSPNDETLFSFERSVGVANVRHYLDSMTVHPRYITTAVEGAGFGELVAHLIGDLHGTGN